MTGTIYALLLQQSELGQVASLWGRPASRHFGKSFDRLLAKGVLSERAPAEYWDTCRYCTCDYDHRLIREINGRLLAICPWDHKADDELEPVDLRSFAINRERLVDLKRGFARLEWQKLRERNEALDCRVYARSAAWILGADRWSDKQWDELARQVAAPDAEAGTGTVKAVRQNRPASQRRSVRSNYMR